MRKWMFSLLVIVCLSLLGAYYAVGIKAEARFKQAISLAKRIPNVTVKLIDYQRGWFRSKARLEIQLHKPDNEQSNDNDDTLQFKTVVDISHGPIILGSGGISLGLAYSHVDMPLTATLPDIKQFASDSKKPRFISTLLFKFNNNIKLYLSVPKFKLTLTDGSGEFAWNGLDGHWYLSANLRQIKGRVDFDGLTFKDKQSDGKVTEFNFRYHGTQAQNGVWAGNAFLDLKAFEVNLNGQKKLAIMGFSLGSESDVTNNLVDSTLNSKLDRMVVDGVNYGPALVDVSAKQFDAVIFGQMQQQLQQAEAANLSGQQRQMVLMGLLAKLPQLLAHGAEVELKKLNVTLPQGVIDAHAKLHVPKASKTPTLDELIARLNADARINIPVSLVKQALSHLLGSKIKRQQVMQQLIASQTQNAEQRMISPSNAGAPVPVNVPRALSDADIAKISTEAVNKQLGSYLQSGLLTQKGDAYQMVFSLKKGQLLVNGNPFTHDMIK